MLRSRKRPPTVPPPPDSYIFAVRSEDRIEANLPEREAWSMFIRWCTSVPEGTKVELLRGAKVIAWLDSAGTRPSRVVESSHAAPLADVA